MRLQSLFLSLAACAAITLPQLASAGEWPAGAQSQFLSQCEKSAGEHATADQAKTACECSDKAITAKLSTAELKQVADSSNGVPAALQKKMMDAAASCRTKK
ncbi:hypothetical protein [Pseudomonas eucalypticola]|uniref:Secreted protein n=1 Tax=Pseudomonas eucalypticola TaxID=2599595 RepID=A0A7D5HI95_9PSED|nr:hypothetical protein [Pseudomonas eucalypticola]QKZ05886.1 hypothetical protein HWQ56_19685 [Pseudomonas eucalypticola]